MIEDIVLRPHPMTPSIPEDRVDYSNTVFVVFDTVMFSSSVVTLLESYVDLVRPVTSASDLKDYEDKEDWIIGGEGTYSSADFENSVHHIKSVLGHRELSETKAVLNSNNGAVASHKLARDTNTNPADVIIGAPSNIESVREYLQEKYSESDEPYTIVMYGAGHNGHPEFEDIFASWVLYINLENDEAHLSYDNAQSILTLYIESVEWSSAPWFNEEDIDLLSQWNTSKTVPVFDYKKDGFIRHSD